MKLDLDTKTEIQCFVYFLFNGSLFSSNSPYQTNYLDYLLSKPGLLYNCFEVFVYYAQKHNARSANVAVCEYIEQVTAGEEPQIDELVRDNQQDITFWNDFLELAHQFCFDEMQESGIKFDIQSLNGVGSDAVPIFAVWTNLIELDSEKRITNKQYAHDRLLQRFGNDRHGKYIPRFENWEIEQEIY